MRKKHEEDHHEGRSEIEIMKAVAQAWHGHSGSTRSIKEWDAHKANYRSRPSRFKIEAMKKMAEEAAQRWDFNESLWDSYEIVAVSKQLETRLSLETIPPSSIFSNNNNKRREGKNSLRKLLARSTSRRHEIHEAAAEAVPRR
ncbi:hypothetical protein EJ110_NYTH17367 [Nymphaea thermarum]|nr:hypothetical protein EJ110_NYTH17367 [Nymphaea thermarum]